MEEVGEMYWRLKTEREELGEIIRERVGRGGSVTRREKVLRRRLGYATSWLVEEEITGGMEQIEECGPLDEEEEALLQMEPHDYDDEDEEVEEDVSEHDHDDYVAYEEMVPPPPSPPPPTEEEMAEVAGFVEQWAFVEENEEEDCCGVCLFPFDVDNRARLAPYCRHLFHAPCITRWLAQPGMDFRCTLCHTSFLPPPPAQPDHVDNQPDHALADHQHPHP